jgi:DNA replication and repair protein RecF
VPRSLAVEVLSIRSFRNLKSVDVKLGPQFNVVSGDNAQGKTNLLEAVYVLATSRSFRTSKLNDLIAVGAETASARGEIREDDQSREQSVGLRRGLRSVRIDGKRPASLAGYALRTPTVVFHPGALTLTMGAGGERRKLLDRIALYLSATSLEHGEAYAKALRARQRVLETRGEAARDLGEWEELMTRHGRALTEARIAAAAALIPAAERSFARIGPRATKLGLVYQQGAPSEVEAFRAALLQSRSRDRARGTPSVGPHRDELLIELGQRSMRTMASQGQHRAVVLALKLAEIEVVAAALEVRPILLLDDVSSELDRVRTAALFAAIHDEPSQVLLTTTRPDLIDTGGISRTSSRRDFSVEGGCVATT